MLEVKNLKKVYKTKKGADVFALDGVSLKFEEKGMVFLLGNHKYMFHHISMFLFPYSSSYLIY